MNRMFDFLNPKRAEVKKDTFEKIQSDFTNSFNVFERTRQSLIKLIERIEIYRSEKTEEKRKIEQQLEDAASEQVKYENIKKKLDDLLG